MILGTMAINNAHILPELVPKTGIAGEKAKDNNVGAIVLEAILVSPNVRPKKAPILGPKIIEAIMIGICIKVAFTIPKCINPSGVRANNKIIDKKMAVNVKSFVFNLNTFNHMIFFN